jgi:predicted ATPase/class 3 adenylate cyclase
VAAGAPSGVVTFLFTDIEGSTRRWETDAPEMRAALATHDEVLRSAIEAHGGWMFKHTGDGVCAAFASPRGAVDAAVAAQRALELPVRMGIATGEAELRGQDYFGIALNRAARVMAAGHGGQVLLVDSTAALLSGVELLDLGPRRLRDLPTPVGVFQVRADGLDTEFPPLRTLDSAPGNLHATGTSFVGRAEDVSAVAAALGDRRLVTLTGVGGVGKTRLALEVAQQLSDEFPDGVWVFELAAVSDAVAVPDAVAAALGVTQQHGATMAESVAAAQAGRARLLIFDNCEHVLDAAADLVELILAQSTTVKILATSREGLGVAEGQVWPVQTLDVRDGGDSSAVTLFVDRARTVAPHFTIAHSSEAAATLDICRRLDGIPLAIELAASRMSSMTASEVRDRLDHRFRLLIGSRRSLERHQTLRHAVAWSYDHLEGAEQTLFKRCSVFAGGFDLESACALAESDDDYAVLNLLDALVRKSLLIAAHGSGRTRYSMLETIRQFAEDELVADGTAGTARAAHAAHFAAREADILALWDSPRQREAFDWFTTELANLRSAFRWAADQGDLDIAAPIAAYASELGTDVNNSEPIAWAEELIEVARSVNHPRLASLYVMAARCVLFGRTEDALRYCEAGQAVIANGGDESPYSAEAWLGAAYEYIGQPERLLAWCRTQLARDPDNHALVRASIVFALAMTGAFDEARAAAVGMVESAEASQNPFAITFVLHAYGFALSDAEPLRALDVVRRGLQIAQRTGNRFTESHLAHSLFRIEAQHGDPATALGLATMAVRLFHDAGAFTTMRNPLAALTVLLDRLGRFEPAATLAGYAASPMTAIVVPELHTTVAHLREVLGDETYESHAAEGEAMTDSNAAQYAYMQIEAARTDVTSPTATRSADLHRR